LQRWIHVDAAADRCRRLTGERDFAKLGDELQFVRLYLELQQRRFADRLTVILPTAAEIPAVWVPSLILQPLSKTPWSTDWRTTKGP